MTQDKYLIELGSVPLGELALKKTAELRIIEKKIKEQVGRIISNGKITYMIEGVYTKENPMRCSLDLLVSVVVLDTKVYKQVEELRDLLLKDLNNCK